MEKIDVIIETLSPVVLSATSNSTIMTDTRSCISGTVLRGILADRYIRIRGLGEKAHHDEGFRRLFFSKLRFVDANPSEDGQCSFVLPLSMQQEKARDGKTVAKIQDLAQEEHPEDGYKALRGRAVLRDGKLKRVDVSTSISLHISRSEAQERLVGSSKSGKIFNYESIDAGQVFQGSILGEREDLEALVQALDLEDGGMDCRIGRSRYVQYGACRIKFLPVSQIPGVAMADIRDNGILLRLDTTYLPAPGYQGSADRLLQAAADALGAENFTIRRVHAAVDEVENFVGAWKMKQPRQYGLAAGTVFLLQRKEGAWRSEELECLGNLIYRGIGIRREEGFGQLRIWPWQKYELVVPSESAKADDGGAQEVLRHNLPESLKNQVKDILRQRILEQLRVYAGEDVEAMRIPGGSTHFFNRLLDMLERVRNKDSVRQSLKQLLVEESSHRDDRIHDKQKERTPFERKLAGIDVRDNSLEEYLYGRIPMPYEDEAGRSWQKDVGDKDACSRLMKEIGLAEDDFSLKDGEYFYAYWHGVFRLARKKATKAKGAV